MMDCYIIGFKAVACLLFVVGLGLMVYGYRKYNFNPLAFIVPFVGATLSFPVFFALKERHLKNGGAPASDLKRAHAQTFAGWVFFAVMLAVTVAVGVSFFVEKMGAMETGSDVEPFVWAGRLFWGSVAVCGAYAVAVCSICCCGKK